MAVPHSPPAHFLPSLLLCIVLARAGHAENGPRVGQHPPALSVAKWLQVPDRADTSWGALKGKVVILEFWATWCGPCIANIPHLNELADHFKGQDVVFISLTDEPENTVAPFLARKPIHGWVALDNNHVSNDAYGVTGIPHTFLISRDGTLLGHAQPDALTAQVIDQALHGRAVRFGTADEPPTSTALPGTRPAPRDLSYRPGRLPGEGLHGDATPAPLLQVIIRPTQYPGSGGAGASDTGMTWLNAKPADLLNNAYDTRVDLQVELPDTGYEVAVSVPKGRRQLLKPMLREALERAFNLTSHTERRTVSVYVLQQTPDAGKKLTRTVSTGGGYTSSKVENGTIKLSVINGGPASLAGTLESRLRRPVIDQTHLQGGYDFEIAIHPDNYEATAASLERELGLKLVPADQELPFTVIRAADQ